ncbi:unnamed protein product [Didymodactylos carnosus]|uniref:Guanylate cyclase domain-containing protein n=1 Tax=Didymodactylos carnosus TaxID=1234261 RepID=A0A814R5F9_9BILA|nr:unnamed protein product [Didymodactylos carnosus]CAF1129206.1 unnamed protein product [Didymodactylos carnosus]CAF3857767.1 unnamed protein product [Didymodactylos carnosus]CAF3892839.1 unnamed protein product [Didymodactylos carnosus]
MSIPALFDKLKNDPSHTAELLNNHFAEIILSHAEANDLPRKKHKPGYLLYLDISDFTVLSEQESLQTLTSIITSYFSSIVSVILSYHGDIYKFAGDGLLALWTDDYEQLLSCACQLQQHQYTTNDSIQLQMKIVVTYDAAMKTIILGNDEFKHYVTLGKCLQELNECEAICQPGEIIITPSMLSRMPHLLNKYQFIKKDNNYISLKYPVGALQMKQLLSTQNSLPDNRQYLPIIQTFLLDSNICRQLSELQCVTITFINLDTISSLIDDYQRIFLQIYEITKTFDGLLTKTILFDKDWSFLCVFGLSMSKDYNSAQQALKSSFKIHEELGKCSIGVSTGLTYCGIIGDPRQRCEYTVIGREVNLAARLMSTYKNVVSCDERTMTTAQLNSCNFHYLVQKELKGLANVGQIWQYKE